MAKSQIELVTDIKEIMRRVDARIDAIKYNQNHDKNGRFAKTPGGNPDHDLAAGHNEHSGGIKQPVQGTAAQKAEYGKYMADTLGIDMSDKGPMPELKKHAKAHEVEAWAKQAEPWIKEAESRALKMMENNCDKLWETLDEKSYRDGKDWYMKAHLYGEELAKEFNVKPEVAIGILAALSPQLEWGDDDKMKRDRRSKFHNQGQAIRVLEVMTGKHGNGLIIPESAMANAVDRQKASLLEANARAREKQVANGKEPTGLKGIEKRISNILDARNYNGEDETLHGKNLTTPDKNIKTPNVGNKIADLPADILAQMHPVLEGLRPNIAKGIRLYRGDSADSQLGGPKVRSFFNNMLNPQNTNGDVTVDTHMVRALMGDDGMGHRGNNKAPIKGENVAEYIGNDAKYDLFGQAIRNFAKKHDLRGHEAQAILWLLQKKRGRVLPERTPSQDKTHGRGVPTNIKD